MHELELFRIDAIYRDDVRIKGYTFGDGEEAVCVMGSMRGNEYQQMYVCSLLVNKLKTLESQGRITPGKKIMVVPCANPYSVNVKKRFWTIDNTDINRMFPGYDKGETTQRIAEGIFRNVKNYNIGIQLASFYMPGNFVSQVRIMHTGLENVEMAKQFGLPFVVLHHPRPFDTATLNYNWQIWDTNAFSVYTTSTGAIDKKEAHNGMRAILNFMAKNGIIDYRGDEGYISRVVESTDFKAIRSHRAGFFESHVNAGDRIEKDQKLAIITDPMTAEVREILRSDIEGVVAFMHNETLCYQNTAVIKVIPDRK